ncbi:uncharacterized protein LOC122065609 [Macadamia integrifolia]|uniref:uncharacterized protein LOC122065609 n=1 Tax=Macadamia integrifolia TaxID=60698 RepID=UPI001C4FDA86|nr:uncharacterized protein LOC122065609 [Macadamia integrifolia]
MDTKALAKSKRAHSQHHSKTKRPHPNQTSKVASVAATASAKNEKNPSGKQTKEKTRQFHGSSTSALPSNWDRYDEEFDSGPEDLSLNTTSRASDVVTPKSKGADYSYLISLAESQLQSQNNSNLDGSAFFDDSLQDLNQGGSSMLSVRGNRILSWIGDDDFIVDENVTTSYEASFLSMDLHALAGQLEKVDISKRLFIEADLLPPELNSESEGRNRMESDHCETICVSEVAEHISDKLYHERADREMIVDYKNDAPSATSSSEHPGPVVTHEGALLVNPAKIDSRRSEKTDMTEIAGSISQSNLSYFTDSDKKSPMFAAAAAAEAELDLLLDSFGESKFLDSSGLHKETDNSFRVVGLESSTSSPGLTPVQAQVVSKSVPVTVNLDDAIDDLLWGASNPKNEGDRSNHQGDKAVPPDLPSTTMGSGSNSKVLADFDSWLDTI